MGSGKSTGDFPSYLADAQTHKPNLVRKWDDSSFGKPDLVLKLLYDSAQALSAVQSMG